MIYYNGYKRLSWQIPLITKFEFILIAYQFEHSNLSTPAIDDNFFAAIKNARSSSDSLAWVNLKTTVWRIRVEFDAVMFIPFV